MAAIARDSRDYVEWLAANTGGAVQRAARGYLELCGQAERN